MVVIRNVLGGHLKIHKKYDLKGEQWTLTNQKPEFFYPVFFQIKCF